MTAMKDAYNKAKKIRYDDTTRLLNEAKALLEKYDRSVVKAVLPFVKLMRSEPSLMTELAKQYLERVSVPKEGTAGAAQNTHDNQASCGRPVEIEEVHVTEHMRSLPGKGPRERTEREKESARRGGARTAENVLKSFSVLGRTYSRIQYNDLIPAAKAAFKQGVEQTEGGLKRFHESLVALRTAQAYPDAAKQNERVSHFMTVKKFTELSKQAEEEAKEIVKMGVQGATEKYKELTEN